MQYNLCNVNYYFEYSKLTTVTILLYSLRSWANEHAVFASVSDIDVIYKFKPCCTVILTIFAIGKPKECADRTKTAASNGSGWRVTRSEDTGFSTYSKVYKRIGNLKVYRVTEDTGEESYTQRRNNDETVRTYNVKTKTTVQLRWRPDFHGDDIWSSHTSVNVCARFLCTLRIDVQMVDIKM